MNLNRCMFVLISMLTLVIPVVGCRDNERTLSEIMTGKFGKLPVGTEERLREVSEGQEDIWRLFSRVPPNRRKEFIAALAVRFRKLEFDERSYALRAAALSDYFRIVSELTDRFRLTEDIQDTAWRFKLDALDRVNEEIRRCENEPPEGVYSMEEIGRGPFMTKQLYLESLKTMRSDFIWRGFEMNPFSLYFKSLPEKEKADWQGRLKKVARRELYIWDPDNPTVGKPTLVSGGCLKFFDGTNKCDEFLVPIKGGTIKMRRTEKWKKE